jgi:outer membrane protein assembly factor BamE (lipoprotein component of BamABCDE complex)
MFSVKSSILFITLLSAGALAFGTGALAATETSGAAAAKSEKSGSVPRPDPKLPLKKGMAAADIKERWGEPASLDPFPSATGKAEVWTYYYPVSSQTTQVVTKMEDRPTYLGPVEGVQNIPHMVYGLKRSEVNRVVKLLLFDGVLASWKTSLERTERLE